MKESPIIPEFSMYENGLKASEIEEIANRFKALPRTNKNRFMQFTDILTEYIGSGEWRNQSETFLAMCAKAAFYRGMYGYNLIIARGCSEILCKGYLAAAYCRQSLDPRWINNLRNYLHQAWHAKHYVAVAELSTQLSSILVDLGYTDNARDVASESIEKVTKDTTKDETNRSNIQSALLSTRIQLGLIEFFSGKRDEALIRLDSAEDTAKLLDQKLAQTEIKIYRALVYEDAVEYERALVLLDAAIHESEQMGYPKGISDSRNLKGIILSAQGHFQEARDQFEELLVIQQKLNDQVGLAKALINVGEIDRRLGQFDQMETYNLRALEISQESEDMKSTAIASINLGDVALRRGELDTAIKYYNEAAEIAACSGMNYVVRLIPFLVGDAHILKEDYESAIELYQQLDSEPFDFQHPLESFNSVTSQIVATWMMGDSPSQESINKMKLALKSLNEWTADTGISMQTVRQQIFDDPKLEGDACIFYDSEKNFECRVERSSLQKECNGNLFWKGSSLLCPYFIEFLKRIDES
ncbi:MAG: tetratricopeptide repeat protein [Candidatus Thorarchaeota archaeon]